MKADKGSDLGSWKCGKGKAFTHIPTNFFIFFEIIPFKIIAKRPENSFLI